MNSVDLLYISEVAVFIGMANVGIVQLVKNFTKKKKGSLLTIVSLIVTIILCVLNTDWVPITLTVFADLVAISISISQLAWDILAKAVPDAIGGFVNKVIGQQRNRRKDSEEQ